MFFYFCQSCQTKPNLSFHIICQSCYNYLLELSDVYFFQTCCMYFLPTQTKSMFDQDFKTDSTDLTFQDTCVGQLRNSCDVFICLYFYIAMKILSLGCFFGEVLCSMERRSHSNHPPSQVQYIPQPTRLKSSSNLDSVFFWVDNFLVLDQVNLYIIL